MVDGTIFPDAIDELAPACREQDVPLHYVVLRCPFDVARDRVASRDGKGPEPVSATRLEARFSDLGRYERHAVDASGPPEAVAAAVATAFTAGALRA